MPFIESAKQSVDVGTVDGAQEVLDAYEIAERDYLSIPLLLLHVQFLVDRHAHFSSLDPKPLQLDETFSTLWTHEAITSVVSKGLSHLTESYRLWEAQREWEFKVLEEATSDEKPTIIQNVERFHLSRLEQPHDNHEQAFQSYSSFTTNYKPPQEYETLLVHASEIRAKAAKVYSWRESYETSLVQSGYSLAAYNYYVTYERRARKPDLTILSGIHERAIAEAAKRRMSGEPGAEEALRLFWASYVDALRIHLAEPLHQGSVFRRAVRSVPNSGEIWARYIRFVEANESLGDIEGHVDSVEVLYEKALTVKAILNDLEQFVPVVLARVGYEHRKILAGSDDVLPEALYSLLNNGIRLVHAASKTGDPRFRLEKALADLHRQFEEEDRAAEVWARTAKHYRTNYLPWIEYTTALRDNDDIDSARAIFSEITTKKLDWPEAVWEAWIAFEHTRGTVQTLNACLDAVERAQKYVNDKRAKEAEKAAYQAMQVTAEQIAAQVPVTQAIAATQQAQADSGQVPMEVDSAQATAAPPTNLKRKAEDSVDVEDSKKAKREAAQPLKRDRENSTVFVGDLPTDATEDELRTLFKDCGAIREVKLTSLPNTLVATVEFMERDSVPAALTKDKKRLHDQEIAVHLAWQSTLYVTNFPEKTDDAAARELFGKYGLIFDVRWPSKKFKSTRRFCYVQYVSPASAKAALVLHGHELEEGLPLSVYISNPERKKERTDADANAREVYVAGLSKFVTKEDLEKLFKTYGPLKDVRMTVDANGHSKGFAFVEFEEEKDAVTALNANNYDLKKRRIAVTLADQRRTKKREPDSGMGKRADTRSRSVRVLDLPPNTQDGLLQQAIEKYAPVNRVEVFVGKNEAVVEFQTQADAAKILLLPNPIVFNGHTLRISESVDGPAPRAAAAPPTAGAGGLFVPRNLKSRPRAGLGAPRKAVASTSVAAASTPVAGPSPAFVKEGEASSSKQSKVQDDFRNMLSGGK
ncbi:hypothetical protein FA95DRAFT_1560887 [Auriscalpium vulgare]|uniref:Uncharacterized protein n=1 Tax=Auriscalpium vulgare TaxID=40419 RepID=A0ACB8RP27_9AGAM|nr:hypothetical protein FA95DRAFT_1560887 [Auriscalpium vulgare]